MNNEPRKIPLWMLGLFPSCLESLVVGRIAAISTPQWLISRAVRGAARLLKVNCDEMQGTLEECRSLACLFTRSLKPGCRPVGKGFVSPVDGRFRGAETIAEGPLTAVKGQRFTVGRLTGDAADDASFRGGHGWHFYLSPQDYHHVHSPVDGDLYRVRHIPGHLFPVNEWGIRRIPDLFPQSERLVFYITTAAGPVVVVMIGALHVGKMSVAFDSSIVTNNTVRLSRPAPRTYEYEKTHEIRRGERIGTFHLGSSVIVLTPPGGFTLPEQLPITPGTAVRYGQSLCGDWAGC